MEDLNETPMMIGPDKFTQQERKYFYQKFVADKGKKVLLSPYENADLIRAGREFAVLDHSKKEITYYMSYSDRSVNGMIAGFQNMVWRNLTIPALAKIPTMVFFDYLFPEYNFVTTDNVQTDFGKGFWRNAIGLALSKGLHVYYFDLNDRAKPSPIKTQDDFDAAVGHVWGKGNENRYRLVAISKKPIETEVGASLDDFGIPGGA